MSTQEVPGVTPTYTAIDCEDYEPAPQAPKTREEQLAEFRALAQEELRRRGGDPEALGILLRHSIHPFGYALAFEFMAICAELTGEPLDARGVWPRGAANELWLPKVLASARPPETNDGPICTPAEIANGTCPR